MFDIDYPDFDDGFEMDCSYLDEEDFGMAKSFSKASPMMIAPGMNLEKAEEPEMEKPMDSLAMNEIRTDGFCFKMHPSEDQAQFQRDLKKMAPKMTDFAKGTTTLAFEF